MKQNTVSRRKAIQSVGAIGTAAAIGAVNPCLTANTATADAKPANWREQINQLVQKTLFIDTHEHLIEEDDRLNADNPRMKSNDWSFLLCHYIDSDLLTAGMPPQTFQNFLSPDVDPIQKWDLLAPFWPAVKNTGYGQAVDIAMRELYEVDGLSRDSVPSIQERYLRCIKPGFYHDVLQNVAGIESCQVNCLSAPFGETRQPALLMQDISIVGMHIGPNIQGYASKAGIEVHDLADWHRVIDWWFDKYGPYAVAVKSQAAYGRNIDYEEVPAETAEPLFKKRIDNDPLTNEEKKQLEDHLFWYSVRKATEWKLPVKLHTGYYAGQNSMPLSRLQQNPAAITDLCKRAPDTTFVFMHICYPYYEELIAAAKHYTNAYVDMCWAWIISPVAGVNFLKQYLVTAPANKILTFGGDYIVVEPVVGHAAIARRGITQSLAQLVEEEWLSLRNAVELIEPIMNGNAQRIFRLEEKRNVLKKAPWI
ncbi:MAG: hypothetical protein C4527_00220 [Candidatus Omnitrophota bacterium]|jgi:predicted TIM-barrel fold metal-dependent hydrolase|nr:MAG: hypothetical protein C4527_00220 [Candidatus Omnitrophota bacterium]